MCTIDYMVNTIIQSSSSPQPIALAKAAILVRTYLLVVLSTLVTLAVLTHYAPQFATSSAWGHTIIVAIFAIILPLRLRRAQKGRRGAIRAVGLISAVLFLVNVTESLIPGFVPLWMRIDMGIVALLMIGIVLEVVRWAVAEKQ